MALKAQKLAEILSQCLEDNKAEDIVTIDLSGKSDIADFMVIASGRSQRHVAALAEHLQEKLRIKGQAAPLVEGMEHADWVIVDTFQVIVHLFHPETRKFYNLEKMWGVPLPDVLPAEALIGSVA